MILDKKKILPLVTVIVIGSAVFGLSATQARAETNNNPFSGLIQFISQKLGLDQNKVNAVVDEYHTQQQKTRQQTAQQREKERLDKLVQEKKITADQQKAIIAKLAELRTKYDPSKTKELAQDERKKQMDAKQAEIKAWAKEQGIDEQYVLLFGGPGGQRDNIGRGEGHKGFPSQ
jgi:type I site-specific restriction-modification system R (restriction) subunit